MNMKETLKLITEIAKLDEKLFKLDVDGKPEMQKIWNDHGSWFLHYYMVLDLVWMKMYGKTEKEGYAEFKASKYDQKDVPVAWYKTRFNTKTDGSIKGPGGYGGYIPDCIDMVILSHKLTADKKLKLLTVMFADLKKLKKKGKSK